MLDSDLQACPPRGPGLIQLVPHLHQRGFSVTDLLLTLTVLAVVLAAAVPSTISSIRTYQRNEAARQVLAAIRSAQSQAVMRGSVMALQWGADTGVNRPASQYRVVRDTTASCSFPGLGVPEDNTNVIRSWQDLSARSAGTTIQSMRDANNVAVGVVMFSPVGASVNTCAGVTFPVTVTVSDASGTTRDIEIRSAGGIRLL